MKNRIKSHVGVNLVFTQMKNRMKSHVHSNKKTDKYNMKKIMLLSSLLLFVTVICNAADNNIFKYRKTATNAVSTSNNADIAVIQFGAQFFDRTINVYHDLRISSPDGLDIPFTVKQFTVVKNITNWRRCPGKIIALKKKNNSIILEVKQTIKHNQPPAAISRLKIITPNRNFEKNITIEGSNDRKQWQSIATKQPFFDYSRMVNLRNNTISFPVAQYRFFKIIINNYREDSESPLYQLTHEKRQGQDYSTVKKMLNRSEGIKITAIELGKKLIRTVSEKSAKKAYEIKVASIEQHDKVTEIIITTQRQPLTGFKLASGSKNFSRRVAIAYQSEKSKWYNFTTGVFEQIAVKGFQSNQTTITFPESRYATYKITINNLDNKPLTDLNITANGNIYRALMLGKPLGKVYLLYGEQAKMPHYDINTALSRITTPTIAEYKLSAEELNPDYQPGSEKTDYKLIFICLISLTALILAVILFKNFGKLNEFAD
jgi:Protein of unknown function (DUF3999)